ncbi:MAG: HAD family phosphatase [Candidatus Woesearchaeota archaeon]|nr:MAG: HAD family phosphatase [Candidatus Woesearchaeota archaeon]
MIKIIIFDLGNVVLANDWHHQYVQIYEDFSNYFNISYDNMERAWYAFWPQFKLGKMTEEEFWERFLQKAGAKNIDINHAKKLWRKYQHSIENMLDLLKKLKEHYRLAALANAGKEWLDHKKEKFRLNSYFEVIIGSGHVGLAKPDPKFYDLILKELKTDPKECLFVDDKERSLVPAEKLGMQTILFTNQKQLEKDLINLGIKF